MAVILGNLTAVLLVVLLAAVSAREIWKGHKNGSCGGCTSCGGGSCKNCGSCAGRTASGKEIRYFEK